MTRILVDTSMWIEFFSKTPRVNVEILSSLSEAITDQEAVIIEAIRAELLLGHIPPKLRSEITQALDSLDLVDLDWNSRDTWDQIVLLAEIAKQQGLPIPGVIDRMILLSALNMQATIASCDHALLKLAAVIQVPFWSIPQK
jgi:predicted nucleic acid-binding protein